MKLLIDILREEIKNVDSEKIELEERYKSVMLASFGIVGLSKKRAKEQKKKVFQRNTPVQVAVLERNLEELGGKKKN